MIKATHSPSHNRRLLSDHHRADLHTASVPDPAGGLSHHGCTSPSSLGRSSPGREDGCNSRRRAGRQQSAARRGYAGKSLDPLFVNPVSRFCPCICIGIVAALVFSALHRWIKEQGLLFRVTRASPGGGGRRPTPFWCWASLLIYPDSMGTDASPGFQR